jgi:hypothetical protein
VHRASSCRADFMETSSGSIGHLEWEFWMQGVSLSPCKHYTRAPTAPSFL